MEHSGSNVDYLHRFHRIGTMPVVESDGSKIAADSRSSAALVFVHYMSPKNSSSVVILSVASQKQSINNKSMKQHKHSMVTKKIMPSAIR